MIDYRRGERFWERSAGQAEADLDQVAAHNTVLPLWFHRRVRSRQVARLAELLQGLPGRRDVLDLGCGPGLWARELAPLVDSWLGIDIAPTFVEEARRQARLHGYEHLEFRQGSLLDPPPERTFDAIVLGGTLSLLNDRDLPGLMERVRRQLRPGGAVYVRVSTLPYPYPVLRLRGEFQINYRRVRDYEAVFRQTGLSCRAERDEAFTEATLATVFAFLGTWLGGSAEAAVRLAQRHRAVCFGLGRRLLDLLPVPRSSVFILGRAS